MAAAKMVVMVMTFADVTGGTIRKLEDKVSMIMVRGHVCWQLMA